jgi:hypothetical protein
MKKTKSETPSLKDFTPSRPRVAPVPENPDEGIAKMYTNKGRMILTPSLLDHFEIERKNDFPLHYELFFDNDRKLIAIKFLQKKTPMSYIASEARSARFIELKGPCKRQGLLISEKSEPVEVKITRDRREGFIYFSYANFAESFDFPKEKKCR